MTKKETVSRWKRRQREMNAWTDKYLKHVGHLKVDGKLGHATNRRILTIKWYLGYGKKRNAKYTEEFVRRMRHPHSIRYFNAIAIVVGAKRRATQRRRARESNKPRSGLAIYDGKQVPAWMVTYIKRVREAGRWDGWIVSGYRTPEYSEHLCYNMCGRAYCPGRCAGRSTNHAHYTYPGGAIDVSDYYTFGSECKRLGIPLRNSLGSRDPVHYSTQGN